MQVGWDWASQAHDVTVMEDDGRIVDRFELTHDEAGLEEAIRRLSRHGDPKNLPVAIETNSGVVVDRLLDAGHPVVPIHPNSFNAARARWGASAAKSDPGDSYRLADFLRTDGHRLRRLTKLDPATAELRTLVRMRDDHVAAKVAAMGQLAALLDRNWPGAKAIFARLDSDIALDFLTDFPTPESATRLGEARMAMFMKRHGYCGHRTAGQLLARLRSAPEVAGGLSSEVLAELVAAQVQLLRSLLATIERLNRSIHSAVAAHPKSNVLRGLPRVGTINLAQVIAEVGPILDRAATVEQACAEAGAAPVTRSSGKGRAVTFRWAANTQARDAPGIFADNSRHASPWAARLYANERARGKRHPAAIRILMRAWLRVIWACWQSDAPYNPRLHGAEQRVKEPLVA
jgi:hypothetical protein